MGLANLAVVFAPTLFYIKGHKGEKMLQEVEIQVSTATTLQIMIDFHEIFAKVPADIVGQLRLLNEMEMSRSRKPAKGSRIPFFGRAKSKTHLVDCPKTRWVESSTETPAVRALITLTVLSRPDMESVKISDNTLPTDLIKLCGLDPATHFVLEKGGNIGLRRLEITHKILHVIRQNPFGSICVANVFA
eukprot:m.674673 g.674673  ORF g.674673 m.674673 type:complete len:189 (+) comp58551_c0_seq50:1043-1609(+)